MPCGGSYSSERRRTVKPMWAAPLWQVIAARLEKLGVKLWHVNAHVPQSQATEEHQNNQQVDWAAKVEVAQVDLDWQHKGELFVAQWKRCNIQMGLRPRGGFDHEHYFTGYP